MSTVKITTALISVADKTGLSALAALLHKHDIKLFSTGGTAKYLKADNIPVTDVCEYTQYDEMMNGRIKTLHPRIHGGLLGRCGIDDDIMQQHGIEHIQLLIVNLYPFIKTVANPGCTLTDAIENIDIGGPAMIRAAAKNHEKVTVLTSPTDYSSFMEALPHPEGITQALRLRYAAKAFAHTANYDSHITNYLTQICDKAKPAEHQALPATLNLRASKIHELRYGENPHQRAALYQDDTPDAPIATPFTQHQGKAISYNNLNDMETAVGCVQALSSPACVIVKHANPCGASSGNDLEHAYKQAYACDPTSAFGGIIAFNAPLDATCAARIAETQFVEMIIAPEITPQAQAVLKHKPNLRLISMGTPNPSANNRLEIKRLSYGILVQESDSKVVDAQQLRCVSTKQPTSEIMRDLMFAWHVAKYVKSNAVVYAKDLQIIGIGAGQTSRVGSAQLGLEKAAQAQFSTQGSVLASDAFFPFPDGVEAAAKAGILAIIQPGGSIRDEAVIKMADQYNIVMLFTDVRHFKH